MFVLAIQFFFFFYRSVFIVFFISSTMVVLVYISRKPDYFWPTECKIKHKQNVYTSPLVFMGPDLDTDQANGNLEPPPPLPWSDTELKPFAVKKRVVVVVEEGRGLHSLNPENDGNRKKVAFSTGLEREENRRIGQV